MDMAFSCRKNAFFPGAHKIGAAISGPRIADTNFMDTRIFLNEDNPSLGGQGSTLSCSGNGPEGGGVPARRGVEVPARGGLRPVRGQEA